MTTAVNRDRELEEVILLYHIMFGKQNSSIVKFKRFINWKGYA